MRADQPYGLNNRRFPLHLGTARFEEFLYSGVVVDGRAGGLILGRSFDQGGVYVIHQRGKDFMIHGVVECGEFALNRVASAKHMARLKAINSGMTKTEETPPHSEVGMVRHYILTFAEPCDRFLWLNWNQTVVAAEFAEKHLTELIEMNEEFNPYSLCDIDVFFPPADEGTADGIV